MAVRAASSAIHHRQPPGRRQQYRHRGGHTFSSGRPINTPVEIVAMLNKEINAALADAKMQARLAELGGVALPGSVADFGKLIADETEKWAKVVKFADVRVD